MIKPQVIVGVLLLVALGTGIYLVATAKLPIPVGTSSPNETPVSTKKDTDSVFGELDETSRKANGDTTIKNSTTLETDINSLDTQFNDLDILDL